MLNVTVTVLCISLQCCITGEIMMNDDDEMRCMSHFTSIKTPDRTRRALMLAAIMTIAFPF